MRGSWETHKLSNAPARFRSEVYQEMTDAITGGQVIKRYDTIHTVGMFEP